MDTADLRADAPLYEPCIVEDIYINDLGAVEDAGDGNVRFTFCFRPAGPHGGAREVRIRAIAGPTLIFMTIRAALRHFGIRCCGAMGKWSH